MIYLNAASHGLPDRAVLRRTIAHLDLEAMIGPVAAFGQVEPELARVQGSAERLLNADEGTVGFASGTLSAWRNHVSGLNIVGKRLLVAPHEWGENVGVLRVLAAHAGARVEALPPIDFASPDLSAWQARIDDDVAAIFLPMVTSVAGLRYPVEEVGALARPIGCQVIVDAAQALGQVEVDTQALGCDALFATTRKWVCGPRQTALFWTADPEDRAEIEHMDVHYGLRLGLGVALEALLERGIGATAKALQDRSGWIRGHAQALGLDSLSRAESGTTAISLAIPVEHVTRVAASLEEADIVAKWPDPPKDEPLSQLDQDATRVLRLAPHLSTDRAAVEATFEAIAAAL